MFRAEGTKFFVSSPCRGVVTFRAFRFKSKAPLTAPPKLESDSKVLS